MDTNATVRSVFDKLKVNGYMLKKRQVQSDLYESIHNMYGVYTEEKENLTILTANVGGKSRTAAHIDEIVDHTKPIIVWIIESYGIWNPPKNYHRIDLSSYHGNNLWIRNDYINGRTISRIQYGVQVENIGLRYIPPHSNTKIERWLEIEVGDYNILSNSWINLKNVTCENRYGKPGGIMIATKIQHTTKFIDGCADHCYLFTKIYQNWNKDKITDTAKLVNALNDYLNGKTNTDIYKRNNKISNEDRLKIIKQSDKIIDPVQSGLDLTPYFELYNHNPLKDTPKFYKTKIREAGYKKIYSKALDINKIPIYKVLEMLRLTSVEQKQLILNGMEWLRFSSRTVCLKKKGKEPDKVTNLRPIQVSPINFKIAEQSRKRLKNWLNINTHPNCYAFTPGKKIADLIAWIKNYINSQ